MEDIWAMKLLELFVELLVLMESIRSMLQKMDLCLHQLVLHISDNWMRNMVTVSVEFSWLPVTIQEGHMKISESSLTLEMEDLLSNNSLI